MVSVAQEVYPLLHLPKQLGLEGTFSSGLLPKSHIVGITGEMIENPFDEIEPSIPVTLTFTFAHETVHISGDGTYTETVFHDGTSVQAIPGADEAYRVKARLYGYGEDCAALSREHEFLHTFLAERLRGGASHALWAVAHGQKADVVAPTWEQEQEEAYVLSFQQYLNGSEPVEELVTLFEGVDRLARLKQEALGLLRNYRFPVRNV